MQKLNLMTVSVRDRLDDRCANNVPVDVLADAVRPWYSDWADMPQVERAIDGLRAEETRDASAAFLGLELRVVA